MVILGVGMGMGRVRVGVWDLRIDARYEERGVGGDREVY